MANEVTLSNVQIPAHITKRMAQPSRLAESLAGGISSGSVARISIRGSRFRIMEQGTEEVLQSHELEAVIVGANPRLSKIYYMKQWTPDQEPANPDCFSMDGVKPDASATAPQNTQCVDCPHNAWGSRVTPTGTQIKACQDVKRLAVVSASDVGGPIYLLQIPPASLRNLNKYHKELSHRNIPPEVVWTRVCFDTDASHPKLLFKFGGFLTQQQQEEVDKLFLSDEVLEITGEKPVAIALPPEEPPAMEEPQPAPKPQAKRTAAHAQPEAEEPAEAPAKKRGFGSAAPAVAKVVTKPAKQQEPVTLEGQDELDSLEAEIQAMMTAKGGATDDGDDATE